MRLHDCFHAFLTHLEHERHCAERTIVAYRGDFLQFMAWLDQQVATEAARANRRPVNDLTHFSTERIRAWQAHLSIDRKMGVAAVRRKLHAMSSFARFMVRTGAIGKNPMDGVTPPRRRIRAKAGIPLEPYKAIMALPLSHRDQAIRGVLALAGLRMSEVLNLTVGSVRLGPPQPALHVRGKGDRERFVPMPEPLRALLMDYVLRTGRIGRHERLFQTEFGKAIHPSVLGKMVKEWGRRVGIHLHPHMFRHTYATGLAMSGVQIKDLKEWLGHQDIRTTDLYLHGMPTAQAQQALDHWAYLSTATPPALT